MSVEFVDPEKAEALGAECVALAAASGEATVKSWFVMRDIAAQVGPRSNVGVAGLSWVQRGGRSYYRLRAACVDRPLEDTMNAPETLEAARKPKEIAKAVEMLERKIQERGGRTQTPGLPQGTSRALIEALSMSGAGQDWLAATQRPQDVLLRMVRVANAYGPEGVYPRASLMAHVPFLPFDERADLVRAFPTSRQAEMKALSLRGPGAGGRGKSKSKVKAVRTLAVMSGTPERTSRAVLDAVLDGCSERKLMRLVREAVRMANALDEVAA